MARSFLTPINLNKLELQNARIQNLATAPSSPVVGQIYYDTALNGLYIWNGTAWGSADGISSGALGSRPLASAVASGTFFYATDNFLLYYSNGTSWQQTHNFGSGASTALTIAGTSADGTSTNYARADHTHAGPGFGSSTSVTSYGTSKTDGTATTVSHSDHTHGTPSLSTNAASNITATTATNGSGTAPAKDDHVHGFTPSGFALSAFGVPTSAVAFNSQKITGLADPTAAQDAATKNYVDGVAQGLNVHDSALVATITNLAWTYANGSADASQGTGIGATLTNSSTGTSAIDGYTVQLNDRILVKNQTTKTQNGIYTVTVAGTTGVSTVLTRATDADNHIPGQVTAGDFIFVSGVSGTTSQVAQGWSQIDSGTATTPPKAIKIGTDNIEFSQFSGAGTYTASNGVLLTGSNFTFNPLSTGGLQTAAGGASVLLPSTSGLSTSASGLTLNPTSTGGLTTSSSGALIKLATNSGLVTDATGLYVGAGSGIVVSTGTVAIDTTVVVRKYAASIGDGASLSYVVTHNLGTKDVQVTLYDNTTNAEYLADVTHTSTTTITVAFSTAPTTNQIRVVVFG
jgi:co-chaperonin GroES (HSP10)